MSYEEAKNWFIILIVMAAGLGSRYGGFKQIAPVDDAGHILTDYALYDAYRAGQ